MEQEAYQNWLRELEEEAAKNPSVIRKRAFVLYALGFLYLAVVLALAAWVVLWAVRAIMDREAEGYHFFAGAFASFALFGALRAFIGRAAMPGRIKLDLEGGEAPGLVAELDRLEQKLKVPRPSTVWVNEDLNAGVIQRPLFGSLGVRRYDLQIGLPILALCDEAEMQAILAHELAHLSADHGAQMSWVFRFFALFDAVLESGGIVTAILLWPFGALFGRRLGAYLSILSHSQEYEADAVGASMAGAVGMTRALLVLESSSALYQEEFVPDFQRRHLSESSPPGTWVTESMDYCLGLDRSRAEAQRAIEEALAMETTAEDSHPALVDRIKSLAPAGWPSTDSVPALADRAGGVVHESHGSPALHTFLPNWQDLVPRLEDAVRIEMSHEWKLINEAHLRSRERLEVLEKKGPEQLSTEEGWEHAGLLAEIHGIEKGIGAARAFLERNPDHPWANLQVGATLLREGDESGLLLLDRAAAGDWLCEAEALAIRSHWHRRRGENEEAQEQERAGWARSNDWEKAILERGDLDKSSRFGPHELSGEVVDRLLDQIESKGSFTAIHLVRRELKEQPERPQYVLMIEVKRKSLRLADEHKENLLIHESTMNLDSPYDIFFASRYALASGIVKRVHACTGSLIWDGVARVSRTDG